MEQAARCNMRGKKVEQCLASSLTINEWCRLNEVRKATFYNWGAVFRREEPELFAKPTASEWLEISREGLDSKLFLP